MSLFSTCITPVLIFELPENGGGIQASYIINGRAVESKIIKESVFFNLLKGMSVEFNRIRTCLNEQLFEYSICSTIDFLREYEIMLGIPDKCFTNSETDDVRRQQIQAKFLAEGVQTAQDLIDVIALLGFVIQVENSTIAPTFLMSFPHIWQANKIIIITFFGITTRDTFPVDFPWFFRGSDYVGRVQCFIRQLVPVSTKLIFEFEPFLINYLFENGDNYLFENDDNYVFN